MTVRRAALAGSWYPEGRSDCARAVRDLLEGATPSTIEGPLLGGVVPHAGWAFSGETAASVYRTLGEGSSARTLIVLGAVHRRPIPLPAISTDDAWETPLGPLEVDVALAGEIVRGCPGLVETDAAAHADGENSIELQTALLAGILPGARFVPIMVAPDAHAVPFGVALGRVLARLDGRAVVVASTDLTHYGSPWGLTDHGVGEEAARWVRDVNDRKFLDLVLRLEAEEIVPEAERHRNACGAGAVAAAVAAVREMSAREGVLLRQTTSYDVLPASGGDRVVGYAGVVFR
jgi:MEMO1 family protein